MSVARIAWKNIQKKFGVYLVNFISTVFAVTIFNLFCSIYYNPTFTQYRFGTGKISVLFQGTAVAVFLFSTVFVIYSNQYFIKTRKKEIAIYSLLGMRKMKIAWLMFLETFAIGILAVGCGTLFGTCTAGYFTSLLMRFMGAGTQVVFSVDGKAIVVTLVAFALLFVVNGIRSYQTIYHYQLIELLSAEKQGENMLHFSMTASVVSVILLLGAYIWSTVINVNAGGLSLLMPAFGVMCLVTVGTCLLFLNLIPFLIQKVQSKKAFYFRLTNFISISQIAFRIKANARILSVSALLCAATVTMISASYSLYHGLRDIVDFYAPYSYICKNITEEQHSEILDIMKDMGEVTATQDDKITMPNARMKCDSYHPDTERYVREDNSAVYLLSESQYLEIINHTQAKQGEFGNLCTNFKGGLGTEECYLIDCNPVADYCRDMAGSTMTVSLENYEKDYQIQGTSIHKYLGMVDGYKKATVVLSDTEYETYLKKVGTENIDIFYGIMFDDEMASQKTVEEMDKNVGARFDVDKMPQNISYISFYRSSFALYGAYVFIGVFIGFLFLLAVGSLMYYKMIMEAQEEKSRYTVLCKIGMNQKEIKASIRKQLGITYLLPLGVGLLHTVFALLTYNRTLENLGQETPTLFNAVVVVAGYLVLYVLFYLMSVCHYQKIVTSAD